MKETRRDHDSARVSASAASAVVSRSAENSYAAPTRTSQPGEVAEEGRAEAARGGHGADVSIVRADPTTAIDPSPSQIVDSEAGWKRTPESHGRAPPIYSLSDLNRTKYTQKIHQKLLST